MVSSFSELQKQAEALKQQALEAANKASLDMNVLSLDAMQDELDPTLPSAAPSTGAAAVAPAPASAGTATASLAPAAAAMTAAPAAASASASASTADGDGDGEWGWDDDAPKTRPTRSSSKSTPKSTPKKPTFKAAASPASVSPATAADGGQSARLKAALAEAEAREASVLAEATERVKLAELAREKLLAISKEKAAKDEETIR